jgi:hypothetical protein
VPETRLRPRRTELVPLHILADGEDPAQDGIPPRARGEPRSSRPEERVTGSLHARAAGSRDRLALRRNDHLQRTDVTVALGMACGTESCRQRVEQACARVWAKTNVSERRQDACAPLRWHPLLYHLLETAAVSYVLLMSQNDRFQEWLATTLRIAPNALPPLVRALGAAHDIGKAQPEWQKKEKELYRQVQHCSTCKEKEIPLGTKVGMRATKRRVRQIGRLSHFEVMLFRIVSASGCGDRHDGAGGMRRCRTGSRDDVRS